MTMNNIDDVLQYYQISPSALTDAQRSTFDDLGYVVLPPDLEHLSKHGTSLEELRDVTDELSRQEGVKGGWEGMEFVIEREPGKLADPGSARLGNLINKHRCFRALISMPEVLLGAQHLLGPDFRVSAVDMREPLKGGGNQQIHIDWVPRMDEAAPFECMFCFFVIDDMTLENAPLRIIPKSHRILDYPQEHIDIAAKHKDEVLVEAKAGSRVLLNSQVWHGGSENLSGRRRRTFFTEYRLRSIPQLLNQQRYISSDIIADLSAPEKWLLSVGEDFPLESSRHCGPGDAYRRRYGTKSAHEM